MIMYTKNENWNLIWQKCSKICNKQYHLYLCWIVCEMWYIENECPILQLKSIHHTGWMNNMIWKCNITQYLISVHYTYHASLYSWQIYTLYIIHIVQVKHPPQKFPDKNLYKISTEERYNPKKVSHVSENDHKM